MKTIKVMKNPRNLFLVLLIMAFSPLVLLAQDKEKEVKIKVIRDVDGETTVIDTTLHLDDMIDLKDLQEVNVILKEYGIDEIEIDNLEDLIHDLDIDIEVDEKDLQDGETEKIIILKKQAGQGEEGEREMVLSVMQVDSLEGGKVLRMKDGSGSYSYTVVADDAEGFDMPGDGDHKVVVFTDEDGKKTELFVGSGNLKWVDDNQAKVKVIEDENGKKVIVENADGTSREYELPEGKGTYMITEGGELEKVTEDVVWTDDKGDHKRITIHVGEDGQALVIQEDGESVKLEDFKQGHNIFLRSSGEKDGDQQFFVEVIEKKEGDHAVRMKSKIVVRSLGDDDIKAFEKKGVKIAPGEGEVLEVEHLAFHPNPSDGKFNLEFSTPDKGKTQVYIYDVNGKQVYQEEISNFDGHYKRDIDISSEKRGTYFLKIVQGEKISSRKIILD